MWTMDAVLAERLQPVGAGPRPTFEAWWSVVENWCRTPAEDADEVKEEFNLLAGWYSPTGQGSYVFAWAPEGLDDQELFWVSLQRKFAVPTSADRPHGSAGAVVEAWFANSPDWEHLAEQPAPDFIDRSGGAPAFDYFLGADRLDGLAHSTCLRTAATQPLLGLAVSTGALWLWPEPGRTSSQ